MQLWKIRCVLHTAQSRFKLQQCRTQAHSALVHRTIRQTPAGTVDYGVQRIQNAQSPITAQELSTALERKRGRQRTPKNAPRRTVHLRQCLGDLLQTCMGLLCIAALPCLLEAVTKLKRLIGIQSTQCFGHDRVQTALHPHPGTPHLGDRRPQRHVPRKRDQKARPQATSTQIIQHRFHAGLIFRTAFGHRHHPPMPLQVHTNSNQDLKAQNLRGRKPQMDQRLGVPIPTLQHRNRRVPAGRRIRGRRKTLRSRIRRYNRRACRRRHRRGNPFG